MTFRSGIAPVLPLTFLLCGTLRAPAQILPFHAYTTQDGLISNSVTAVLQDSRGYIWIGTDEGLSIYDGVTFTNVTTVDGLSNNYVTAITESRRNPGTIWIGTIQRGLTRWSDGVFSRLAVGTTALTNNITSLEEDTAGTLWCGTSAGVFFVRNDTVQAFRSDPPLPGTVVVATTKRGAIWMGSAGTLLVYAVDGRLLGVPHLDLADGEGIDWMVDDPEGDVWIGTSARTVRFFRDTSLIASRSFAQRVSGMTPDRDGFLWFSTPDGIARCTKSEFARTTFTWYGTACGLPDPASWMAHDDSEGNLWFATPGSGLRKLSERALRRFPIKAMTRNAVLDSACHLWIPAERGVWEAWKADEDRYQTRFHPLPHASAGEPGGPLAFQLPGLLWTSETGAVFRCYRTAGPGTEGPLPLVRTIGPVPTLSPALPLSMIIDGDGHLFCAVEGAGLVMLDLRNPGSHPVILAPGKDIPLASVRAVYQDRRGTLWLGGYNDGVVRLRHTDREVPVVMRHFTMADGLPDGGVRAFAEDAGGRLWIGTRFGGVAVFDGTRFVTLTTRDGILSNAIWSIARDGGNRMWLGTSSGLMAVNPDSLQDFSWTAETAGGGVDFTAAGPDGVLWFGSGLVSLSAYEPGRRREIRTPPPIYITALTVNDTAAPFRAPLELRHDQNSLVIRFAGLSFADERSVRYQYRLNTTTWSRPSPERSVSFAAMRPGSYQFSVRALNRSGVASTTPATLSFRIVPPFWERWWFTAAVLLAVSGLVFLLYRYRVQHLLEIERLRVRIAGDLHDDVGTNLSSILITSQILERQGKLAEQDRQQLREIASVASGTQEMMRDIVWMLNPANDSLDDLLLRMKDTAARLLADVEYSFNAPPEKLTEKVSIEFKRNVFLIFKEGLNNIVRHAGATRVDISVARTPADFVLEMHDNGRGFDPERAAQGMGLSNLRRRAGLIGGTLSVRSAPGTGTTVFLSVQNHANT